MITSVQIEGLRGIREGRLDGLTPLTVLVGPNGSGKSTVLDALLIAASAHPSRGVAAAAERREARNGFLWLLWKRGDVGKGTVTIAISPEYGRSVQLSLGERGTSLAVDISEHDPEGGTDSSLEAMRFNSDKGLLSGFGPPVSPDKVPEVHLLGVEDRSSKFGTLVDLYSILARNGLRSELVPLLRTLLPGAEHLELLTEEGTPSVNVVYPDRAVPVSFSGDGIALLLRLSMELTALSGGLALMEEPEAHLHPAAVYQMARVIVAAVRRGTQVVLTTHSLEMIDALLDHLTTDGHNLLSVFRTRLDGGALAVSRLDGGDVAFSRQTIEDDLR